MKGKTDVKKQYMIKIPVNNRTSHRVIIEKTGRARKTVRQAPEKSNRVYNSSATLNARPPLNPNFHKFFETFKVSLIAN